MRKVCLLGGTGFVGKHLANRLLELGWQVRILTRRREQHRDLLVLPKLELVAANIYDQPQLNAQLAQCEVVINLIGILNEIGNDGAGFRRTHVELTQKIITACQTNQIQRLLHMSSLNADAKQGTSHYLRTKGEAEDLVHTVPNLFVTSFRPSVIFGEDDSFFNRLARLLRLPSPIFLLPAGQTRFAPIWVNDVIDAMILTIDDAQHYGQRYNLCGPNVYTLQELVAYTAKLIGAKRKKIISLNERKSYNIARIMEFIPGKPYSIDNYHSGRVDSICGENNHLLQLGITPHTLEAIMPQYFQATTVRSLYSNWRCQARRDG
jgi:NADH dehydrogenase